MDFLAAIGIGIVLILIVGNFLIGLFGVKTTRHQPTADQIKTPQEIYPDEKAIALAESKPHKKLEKSLDDFESWDAGSAIGYYLPEEKTVELQCNGELSFQIFGDEMPIVRPASDFFEAKRIFDFYVTAMEILDHWHDSGLSIDAETFSVTHEYYRSEDLVYVGPLTICRWEALEGHVALSTSPDGLPETRFAPVDDWEQASLMIDAYRFEAGSWELGADEGIQHDSFTDLVKGSWPKEIEDGSLTFESIHYDPKTGVYSDGILKLSNLDGEQKTVSVRNRMDAILEFYEFAYRADDSDD